MVPSKGNKIFVIPKQHKSWEVSIQLKPLRKVNDDEYRCIVHFTKQGNMENDGDRNPGIWTRPNSLRILTSKSIKHDLKFVYSAQGDLPLNVYTTVTILQRHLFMETYEYSVTINGTVVQSTYHSDAKEHKNMKVYLGNPWRPPADNIVVNNLKFTNVLDGEYHFYTVLLSKYPIIDLSLFEKTTR